MGILTQRINSTEPQYIALVGITEMHAKQNRPMDGIVNRLLINDPFSDFSMIS